jgi:hypothetical protein
MNTTNPAHSTGDPIVSNGTIDSPCRSTDVSQRPRGSVEHVAERLEPATLSAWIARIAGIVVIVVVIPVATLGGQVSPRRQFIEFTRRPGDQLLQFSAIQPDPSAGTAYIDDDSISIALVERGSFAARAVHDALLFTERTSIPML